MKLAHATLGGSPDRNDDRVFVTDNAVVVMDGASAFVPCSVNTGTYVDTLGGAIVHELGDRAIDLRTVVRNAITTAVDKLDLVPGQSPSSTVSIVRVGSKTVDAFVLGDTTIILGFNDGTRQRITDDRIHQIRTPARDSYRARLAAGYGYDDEHRRLLAELQRQQRSFRNVEGGYWIAEADPKAANQAIVTEFITDSFAWAVLCTDGAKRLLGHLNLADWRTNASLDSADLSGLLDRCQQWEALHDPEAHELARAKRHDDKTIAVLSRKP